MGHEDEHEEKIRQIKEKMTKDLLTVINDVYEYNMFSDGFKMMNIHVLLLFTLDVFTKEITFEQGNIGMLSGEFDKSTD